MKSWFALFFFLLPLASNAQISSGIYDDGLQLAFDPQTKKLTGFYKTSTGQDGPGGGAMFTCAFYFDGALKDSSAQIVSWYPGEEGVERIAGKLKINPDRSIAIQLENNPGGCAMANPFADHPVTFNLFQEKSWIQIRIVVTDKAFFHAEPHEHTIRKAYLLKGDLFFVDRVNGNWLHGSYYGQKTTTGWMKKTGLNP